MKRYVKELIDFSNKNWFHAYSIRLLFEIAQCCLHVSQFDLMKECLQCVSEHVHEEDLDARVELAQLYVELYEASNSDKLIEAYAQYFTLSKQRNKISRSMEYQGLHNKLSLEAELHEKQLLLKENKELNKKSESDLFTGVLNKASFVQRVNEELQRIDDVVGGALYVIDVDDFKHVNDDYGHLAGDEVLKKLAKVLQSYTRKSDVVGRIGGDEFCVYMGNIQDTIIIEKKAKQFLSAISKIKVDLAKDYEVKVSIGVASLRVKSDFEKAFAQADEALYEVKTNGKKSFSICYSH